MLTPEAQTDVQDVKNLTTWLQLDLGCTPEEAAKYAGIVQQQRLNRRITEVVEAVDRLTDAVAKLEFTAWQHLKPA